MEETPLLSNACRQGTNRMPQFGTFGSFREISSTRLGVSLWLSCTGMDGEEVGERMFTLVHCGGSSRLVVSSSEMCGGGEKER